MCKISILFCSTRKTDLFSEEMFSYFPNSKIDLSSENVIVIGDASLWKPNMRIYEVKDLAICLLDE